MIHHRTIAFLDILGFKEMIMKQPLDELAHKYESLIKLTKSLNKPLNIVDNEPRLFQEHDKDVNWCISNVFSDSIILISHNDSAESSLKLLVYTWRLSQIMMAYGMPVRGGIAYGDFYINQEHNIFLGKALTDAYELETRQKWIGVSIHNSLINAFPELNNKSNEINIINVLYPWYDVPLKDGTKENLRALNWRYSLIVQNGTRSLFKSNNTQEVEEKINNTLTFAQFIKDSGKLYTSNEDCPLELRPLWIGDSVPPFPHGDNL